MNESATITPYTERIGRFVVLRRLGEGTMGVVLVAYDEELDRRVAIKLLRPSQRDSAETRSRILREARALARLSHPNVVQVYEVGEIDQQIFLVLEYVQGQTLRQWLNTHIDRHINPVSKVWSDALSLLTQAGYGLAAAHRVNLIHRDFKPENVLIGSDLKARVADFSLAHFADQTDLPADPCVLTSEEESLDCQPSDIHLTQAGKLIGTPSYMAPEQFLGLPVDARSDQFSFCITLYEALYGERPFRGQTIEDIQQQICSGSIQASATKKPSIPAWIHRILLRGLSLSPEERWPSMDALLTALSNNPRKRVWHRTQIAVMATGFVLGGVGLTRMLHENASQCEQVGESITQLWNPARKHELQQQFLATGLGYAEETWQRVQTRLDSYTHDIIQMRQTACEEHQNEQISDNLYDLRMECLRTREVNLQATLRIFSSADESVIENAIQAASSLKTIQDCANTQRLLASVPLPEDLKSAQTVKELRDQLALAEAYELAGQYESGLAIASEVLQQAKQIDYPPLLSQAYLRQGSIFLELGKTLEASTSLHEATWLGIASHMDDIATQAMAKLIYLITMVQMQGQKAEAEYLSLATALMQRSRTDTVTYGLMLNSLGTLSQHLGKIEESTTHFQNALSAWQQSLGSEHPWIANVHNNLGVVYLESGQLSSAEDHFHNALLLAEKTLGANHPYVGGILDNFIPLLLEKGDIATAQHFTERSEQILVSTLPTMHIFFVDFYLARGKLLLAKQDYEHAKQAFSEAMKRGQHTVGQAHYYITEAMAGIGKTYLGLSQPQNATHWLSLARNHNGANNLPPIDQIRMRVAYIQALEQIGQIEEAFQEALVVKQIFDVFPTNHGYKKDYIELDAWIAMHQHLLQSQ